MTNVLAGRADTLRYLDADHVKHPSGTFAGVSLVSQDDEKLGGVAGVLLEPATRRVRYFVIARSGALRQRKFLLPADNVAVLRAKDQKLYVVADAEDLEPFDSRGVEPFSDEDAITAMFARPAA